MIQLGLTRVRMLADIGAQEGDLGAASLDPEDPAFVERESARIVVRAHHRNELFARLEPALRRRFFRVGSAHLVEDLLMPLRKAIGNSHRRGNLEDPAKWLTAEIVVTGRGAVLAVTDEGSGFDVERVVGQFENDERYFTREGHGIACFAESRSLVSYADGGRTWLLRFFSDPEPGELLTADERAAFGPVGDASFMNGFLTDQVRGFRGPGVTLDSCRVFGLPGQSETSELAYVLRCRSQGRTEEPMVLTGRLLPEAAARADVSMAEQLRDAGVGSAGGLRIPRPLGAFRELSLALFQLDPSVTLRERMKRMTGAGPIAKVLRVIAIGLAAIHLSTVSLEAEESLGEVLEQHRRAKHRVEARLGGGPRQQRASACFDRLLSLAADVAPCATVPSHGALDWDCLLGSGERWELFRFDRSLRAHPGRDVGLFLADLLRFHALRSKSDPKLWEVNRAVFLESYFEGRDPPWSKDLNWFVAGGLLERLDRLLRRDESKWAPKVDPLLDEIERLLGEVRPP